MKRLVRMEERLLDHRDPEWRHRLPVRNDMPRRLARPSKNKRKINHSSGGDPRIAGIKRKKRQKRLRYCQRTKETSSS